MLSREHPSLDELIWSLKVAGFDDVQVLAFPDASNRYGSGQEAQLKEVKRRGGGQTSKDDSQTTKEGITINPTDVTGLEAQEEPRAEYEDKHEQGTA